jgi:hypothetical protein
MASGGNSNAYNMNQQSWVPLFNSEYTQPEYIMDQFSKPSIQEVDDGGQKEYNDVLKQSVQTGLQSGQAGGGVGGTLTGAGASLGIGSLGAAAGTPLAAAGPVGWGIMAGGLLLSAHEKKKQEEAARDQANINNEITRRNNLIALARDAANNDFRLV